MRKSRKTARSITEGEWLMETMREAGYGNTELALELSLETDNLVSQWRSGECAISDLYMFRLAQLFKVDPYSIRPSLLAYPDAMTPEPILRGLSKSSVEKVLSIIALFRKEDAAARSTNDSRVNLAKSRRKHLSVVNKEK